MADDTLSDAERIWDEGDTPDLTVTLLDRDGVAIPLADILTLKLTQWISQPRGQPGLKINNRNSQNVLNTQGVTVHATSGLVTWQLSASDTAFQSKDELVLEEVHNFSFALTYTSTAGTQAKSYVDHYVIQRRQSVR